MPQGFFFLIWFVTNSNKFLAELPVFYYDKEKNRYSPLKGSIPGSSSSTNNAQEPSTANTQKYAPALGDLAFLSLSILSSSNICTSEILEILGLHWIATLGSETSGGSVYILNLVEPVNFDSSSAIGRMLFKAASFNCTIWTADCNPNSRTNLGAALVNLETGMASWVCRSKSDVLSQQLDPSGNVVLCGLINGAILTVDVGEKQERVSDRLIRHRIP
ncbi:hypothetical protein POTOM_014182 [Populus tomentosa]|uniref:Uncharacterized protein n=1 Tax=Populus tomentosa TaxID=118781 RepID=A0A8X8A1J0_POPTO|nr:hypothetical protein POTOM_014182 [Populus tomentosa]